MRDLALLPDCSAIINLGGDFPEDARVNVDTTCNEIRHGTPQTGADPNSCAPGGALDNPSNVLRSGSVPVNPPGAWLQGITTGTPETACSLRNVILTGSVPMTVTLTAVPAPEDSSTTPPAPASTTPADSLSTTMPEIMDPQPEGVTSTMVLGLAVTAFAVLY
eukprot:Protomagalhaensia_wolfi_Nauph_80__2076@NODE_2329_length_1125_cov_346_922652_g1824_i0_p1_GENE_NODE_2329_length_1125_cov_346_922652_g1824_i0NODE_2329_length_1125_cov_346_922652_g1824_i0_p1_ORF_typecomplete_len163_score31_37_NODE_2329_length_1125_cov_346_922652_g1824_i0326814